MLKARAQMASARKSDASARPLFSSLKDGMQQLVDALVAKLSTDSLVTNALVQGIRKDSAQWGVTADYETASFDGVVVVARSRGAAGASSHGAPRRRRRAWRLQIVKRG